MRDDLFIQDAIMSKVLPPAINLQRETESRGGVSIDNISITQDPSEDYPLPSEYSKIRCHSDQVCRFHSFEFPDWSDSTGKIKEIFPPTNWTQCFKNEGSCSRHLLSCNQ